LAQHIADAQTEPLEYANLAIRGLKLAEIRGTQFDKAIQLDPDLMTIFGGVNDVIALKCDFVQLRGDYEAMFDEARSRDITVLTFTMPDTTAVNPLGRHLQDRMNQLNSIIREVSGRYEALVLDFQAYPIAGDPRLWFEDRLHGNPLGHERVAAALAWRLGVAGMDDAWAQALEEELTRRRARERIGGDFEWAVRYLAPWIGRGIRGIPHGRDVNAKRPVPTVVPRSQFVRADRADRDAMARGGRTA